MSPPPLPLDHHIFISKTTSNDSKLDPGRIDLLLGLALHTPTTTTTSHIEKQQQPSLTLNLLFPTQEQKLSSRDNNFDDVSSFSNSFVSVKREREEDATANNVVYEDDVSNIGSSCRKKKLRLNKQQSDLLEESFKLHTTLNPKQKEALARQLNLRPRQVEVWFQNRRARSKLKQTELDCDFLKKSCEKLAEENEKLHKELQLLKSLNKKQQQQQPFYMHHLPPAQTSRLSTNFICPSCHHHHQQQVLPVSPNNNNSNFLISTKRLFFDPFTKAC